jgi:Flp pilus assembly pilin Flp
MLSLFTMYQNIKNFFLKDEKGQGLVEYALIIILISLIVLIAYNPVTSGLSTAFSRIGSALLK